MKISENTEPKNDKTIDAWLFYHFFIYPIFWAISLTFLLIFFSVKISLIISFLIGIFSVFFELKLIISLVRFFDGKYNNTYQKSNKPKKNIAETANQKPKK